MSELRSNPIASETFGSRTEASPLVSGTEFDLHVGSNLPPAEEGRRKGYEFALQARAAIEAATQPTPEQASQLGAREVGRYSMNTMALRRLRITGEQDGTSRASLSDAPEYELIG